MGKDFIIRRAEERDIHQMAELDKLCFRTPWSEVSFAAEIRENKNALYLVIDDGGIVVGYAGIWIILDEGHITNVAVHPDYRGIHLGHAIVDRILELVEAKGVTAETLEVRPSNAPALALYKSFGFEPAGLRKGYYPDTGEDAIIMWRRIEEEE